VNRPIRIDLLEHEVGLHPLPEGAAAQLVATGAVEATPTTGGWLLRTQSIVGAVRAGDVDLRIRPKLPIRNLLFMLIYAADPRGWREDSVEVATSDDVLELLARSFTAACEQTALRGLLRGYVTREATSSVLRGRLRIGDQLATRGGFAVPAEITYDEYTSDILENAVLAAAISHLQRSLSLPADVMGRLARLERTFGDVTPHPPGSPIPDPRFDRLNARYKVAYRLAKLILTGKRFGDQRGGEVGTGMLFDMNRVFEDFLLRSFREHRLADCRVEGQHVTTLDEGGRVTLRPDFTWWRGGEVVAVGDAKYKDIGRRTVPPDDLYQALTYATVFGLGRAHLVYAAGGGSNDYHTVRRVGVQLHVHHLDLEDTPNGLLGQVASLVDRLGHSVRSRATVRPAGSAEVETSDAPLDG
jgi:5-methylcytosine-specific restriction enzyme subunit McrC